MRGFAVAAGGWDEGGVEAPLYLVTDDAPAEPPAASVIQLDAHRRPAPRHDGARAAAVTSDALIIAW